MPTPIPAPSPALADALSPPSAPEDPAALCGVAAAIADVIIAVVEDVTDVDVETEEVVVDLEAEEVVVELEVMLK